MDLKNLNIKIRDLLSNPKAEAILQREFPELMTPQLLRFAYNMSLRDVLKFAGGRVPKEKIDRVLDELENI